MAYTTDITVPIYSVYIVLAAMLSAVVTVAAVFYKSRKPIDLDQLDCEQQAKLFSPQMLAPQLIFDTSPRPVQPHSLKQKLSPWKSASQHVIDSLKPESVSEYRGKLNFSIAFEKEVSTLHVHLLEAVDLPVKDITDYEKVSLICVNFNYISTSAGYIPKAKFSADYQVRIRHPVCSSS
ncbi:hypothetical protein Y032_0299g1777 [Ancylostoma ceylanicum]|uniref:Uncharacterized protein n=1 Tax=Ancylostoma ceylanicum TaxID=53326 RepID=A0A016S3Y4_9BILA|nr:hypothetical protein Y032_0299g1777 [Ancylostoma ceylanicum]